MNKTKIFAMSFLAVTCFSVTCAQAEEKAVLSVEEKMRHFALGQMMAECAATFRFFADFSAALQQNASGVDHLNNKARGWEGAASLFIASGSNDDANSHLKETIQGIVEAKKTEYAARVELSGEKAIKEMQAEFEKNCMPLVPLQEKAVQSMRQGY